jgi:hypothetical protein
MRRPCSEYDAKATRSITISTADSLLHIDHATTRPLSFPQSAYKESTGSLFRFTADLSTGTLRVRPFIPHAVGSEKPQEWTMAEGLDDLGQWRAAVGVHIEKLISADTTITLLCGS